MRAVSVANAKAHFSEILRKIENGGEIVITRRGRLVASLRPFQNPKKPIDFALLDSLLSRQPIAKVSSVQLIRRMRGR